MPVFDAHCQHAKQGVLLFVALGISILALCPVGYCPATQLWHWLFSPFGGGVEGGLREHFFVNRALVFLALTETHLPLPLSTGIKGVCHNAQ